MRNVRIRMLHDSNVVPIILVSISRRSALFCSSGVVKSERGTSRRDEGCFRCFGGSLEVPVSASPVSLQSSSSSSLDNG